VILNAKIGAVYSILQGQDFMNQMENMKTAGMEQMDAGAQQMQASIDDPNVPEEAKKELRKSLEEIKAAKVKVNEDYNKNKGWADLVMDKAKSLTNVFVSKEDIELVKQYSDKITEAYTGMAPSNFNVPE
jgi:nicotinamide mononucleotide adenylyltransferase